jgi:hypothetical protein
MINAPAQYYLGEQFGASQLAKARINEKAAKN